MKPQVVLYTLDRGIDGLLGEALSGTGTVVLIARTVADALQIICHRGRELALALMDFDGGCRGMTLLSAIHMCFEHVPIVVTASKGGEHVTEVARLTKAIRKSNGAKSASSRCLTRREVQDLKRKESTI